MEQHPKIDRKTLRTPDEFVQGGRRLLDILFAQRTRLLPILGVIATAVAGVYGYDWWTERTTQKAWTEFSAIERLPEAERWEKLKAFAGSSSSNRAGFFASVALADHFYEAAVKAGSNAATESAQAIEWYGKALAFPGLLPKEKALLHLNKGNSLELGGKLDEALSEYTAGAELSPETKPLLYLSIGRLQEAKGDSAKAVEAYQKSVSEGGTGEYAKQAKNSLRRMKSPLFGKQGTAK